jgi:hypothetical protein
MIMIVHCMNNDIYEEDAGDDGDGGEGSLPYRSGTSGSSDDGKGYTSPLPVASGSIPMTWYCDPIPKVSINRVAPFRISSFLPSGAEASNFDILGSNPKPSKKRACGIVGVATDPVDSSDSDKYLKSTFAVKSEDPG